MNRRISLLNRRFTRLLVTADAKQNEHGNSQWVCLCDCGTETVQPYQHLVSGRVKSCGCLRREKRGSVLDRCGV